MLKTIALTMMMIFTLAQEPAIAEGFLPPAPLAEFPIVDLPHNMTDGSGFDWNFNLRHHLTSFGSSTEANIRMGRRKRLSRSCGHLVEWAHRSLVSHLSVQSE